MYALKELQAASSPSRRVNSPFKARSSPLRGAIGRKSSNSPRTRAASQTSPVSPRTRAFAPSSPDSPHGRAVSNEHGHYEQSLSRRVARISQRFGQHVSGWLCQSTAVSACASDVALYCLFWLVGSVVPFSQNARWCCVVLAGSDHVCLACVPPLVCYSL